jgi:hypothetical protein
MKKYDVACDRNEVPGGETRPIAVSTLNKCQDDFSPDWNEISKLAYFNHVSRGSRPGHDVEEWLEAEAQLVAEHNSWGSRGLYADAETKLPKSPYAARD